MIIHKNLLKFLETINIKDLDFSPITEYNLRQYFNNFDYYLLRNFCLTNNLLTINYHVIILTSHGKNFLNILKTFSMF